VFNDAMPAPGARAFELLEAPTHRLLRTVDTLSTQQLTQPSLLPGWSRAHVVAHLVLNAEAITAILDGISSGMPVAMYASQEQRDADIDELSAADPSELRERMLGSSQLLQEAARHMPDDRWDAEVERVPGGARVPVALLGAMRLREVEIHHADLGVGYTVRDWDEEFLDTVFNQVVEDRRRVPALLLTPEGAVPLAEGGPEVTGSRADLTWWLLGRGSGEGLSADPHLPTLGPWR
jgi:maleylpyruvate isomerase